MQYSQFIVTLSVPSSVEYRTAVKRYKNGDKYILKFQPSQKTGVC